MEVSKMTRITFGLEIVILCTDSLLCICTVSFERSLVQRNKIFTSNPLRGVLCMRDIHTFQNNA